MRDILPSEMRESFLWSAEQPDGYGAFREHVVTKATEVMDIRGKLSVNAVDEQGTLLQALNLLKDSADEQSGMSERTV